MFENISESFDEFNDSIDDTGLLRKTASAATGRRVIDVDNMEDAFHQLELSLIRADVERDVAEHIVSETKKKVNGTKVGLTKSPSDYVKKSLREVVEDVFAMNQLLFDNVVEESEKPIVILFTGINGVGKTTTIAKMAQRFEDMGYSSVIANGDTFRAGAHQQIKEHSENLDMPLISHEQGSDPAAVLYDAVEHAEANGIDLVLADTAGRLNTDDSLMNQLEKINRVVDPDYTVLVEDSTAGQDAVTRAKDFDQELGENDKNGLDGVILTKVDATDTGGTVLSIPFAVGLPVLYIGTGESYDDLEYLYPNEFANRVI
jgi:fused signal recognition particle receptor